MKSICSRSDQPIAMPAPAGACLTWQVLIGLCLLWLLSAVTLAATEPQARLDRHTVQLGDSVDLSLRIGTTDIDQEPDFSVLQDDFEVMVPRRSSRHVIVNGRAESSTEWKVTLLPRRTGMLTIPPIPVGGSQTAPLSLEVTEAPARPDGAPQEPVFIEASVDHEQVYVQQQLRLTLRIHHSVPLDNMSLSEPEFDNATVIKLPQNSFSRDVGGTPYVVHELRYAIFPDEPGELTIPELVFSATQPTRTRSIFDLPGSGRAIRKLTPQIQIAVKPIPAEFTGPVWLPASNLTLVQSWSENPHQLVAGESITRTLNLQAEGLPADVLPPLPTPDLPGARLYGDQPVLDNQVDDRGVNGKRVERAALIPTQAGQLEIPGIKVIWWDVESDQQQEAVLTPQLLSVKPATAATPLSPDSDPATVTPAVPPTEAPAESPSARLWQATTAIMALAWLITLGLWLHARRTRPGPSTAATPAISDESARFGQLLEACRANAPEQARRALLSWARLYFADSQLRTMSQLRQRPEMAAATEELTALEDVLFSRTHGAADAAVWEGAALAQALQAVRSTPRQQHRQTALPALYPAV